MSHNIKMFYIPKSGAPVQVDIHLSEQDMELSVKDIGSQILGPAFGAALKAAQEAKNTNGRTKKAQRESRPSA